MKQYGGEKLRKEEPNEICLKKKKHYHCSVYVREMISFSVQIGLSSCLFIVSAFD